MQSFVLVIQPGGSDADQSCRVEKCFHRESFNIVYGKNQWDFLYAQTAPVTNSTLHFFFY